MVVASKIEKGLDLALIADATKSQSADKSNPTITIVQILDYVKDIDEFTKRIPVSKVLDESDFRFGHVICNKEQNKRKPICSACYFK